ncbi:PREDICTED: uncharacterized protein LOC109220870 [Nicotiana attenuata]|uniref:uncharacterized protein LOC109220870 n=1 Tax=Nicotiana attenuata TaxID=49451 RepID=UPI00090546E0|nr:PREDICTED: uncharacterized protein LOC109220870 [Nicotiana attenuata]
MASDMTTPWLVGGDFNVIWDEEEKFGGLPVHINEVDDFRHCINTCNLSDLGFKGSIYTWWNGRSDEDCIFKRLDRCLGNSELQHSFPGLQVTHLSKTGSDHCPLLLKCDIESPPIKKAFRFLNFWTKHESFLDVVKENWTADFSANPFVLFNFKLKKLKKALSVWSRATYGDIFQKIASLEELVLVHERQFEINPTQMNKQRLHKVQAEMIKYLALEEEFWRQKSGMMWFKDGDRNTKFFHAQVKGRRKRLKLTRIQNSRGNWIEEEDLIAEEAVNFYKDQFSERSIPTDFSILDHVPSMVTTEQNERLMELPTAQEVKKAVLGLNGESAGGPDGFTGAFYHKCWDIIEGDVVDMVKAFFCGQQLPKSVTHTNLVLLPKRKEIMTFADMRPISLSNFVNKIFSRVIHERLVEMLPNLISEEQAGFVKGRSIVENVLLTQEIITDIRLRTKAGPNVVIKLDMAKAYDRLSWLFLTKMLRKLGFSEAFIGMIFDLVSNNWYSILINGQPNGFFKSSRGVKQGDPLSPTLFILAAEALSRGLNSLHSSLYFCGFGLPKWSPKINHLSYADDTIIFSSSDDTSLRLVMEILHAYEAASGQLVNKAKSAIYMHHLTDSTVVSKVESITGIGKQEFPFTYLGCPIFYARRRMDYYEGLISKVMDKLQSWKGKLLSVGGRAVLITNVLQSMPVHLLSAVNPPNYVINRLHKIFARFFWNSNVGGVSRHWALWANLCMPYEEGGIGFRSLHDVSKALFCKLWWNFRTKPSLWSSFMSQKYYKKLNAVIVPWREGSHTELGALYFLLPPNFAIDENIQNVNDLMQEGRWNVERIHEILPPDLAQHIVQNIKPPMDHNELDKPFWMLETRGNFSVKSAWEYLRRRNNPSIAYKMFWVKGLPFKISFFIWKVWKAKLPLDDFMRRLGYFMPSKCWCCADPKEESLGHLFFTSNAARIVWRYFLRRAGIAVEGISLHQAITKCWMAKVIPRLKPIMQALPACIVWELWKRRNSLKYGTAVSVSRVIYQVSSTLQNLVQSRKPGLQVPHNWSELLQMLEQYTPTLKHEKVIWEFPQVGWIKVNTDGACRGNPGRSSIGFCLRDEAGELKYAQGKEIREGTNTEAEAAAILEALRMCRAMNFSQVWLQTDSLLLKNIIEGLWKPPWCIVDQIEEILRLKGEFNFRISHTFREGNQVKESTAAWVQRAFKINEVAINTSVQEVPSQDTMVEADLAKNNQKEKIVDTDFEVFKSNEKIKWSGSKLWANQTEEDAEEGLIPDAMQSEEEDGGDTKEDEDPSVNDKQKGTESTVPKAVINEEGVAKQQHNNKKSQNTKEATGEADLQQLNKEKTVATNEVDISNIDPGGTIPDPIGVSSANADPISVAKPNKGQAVQQSQQSPNVVDDKEGEAVEVNKKKKMQELTGNIDPLGNNQNDDAIVSITKGSNMMVAAKEKLIGAQEDQAADMDEESTAQNFLNIARQGDLSPRQIDQVKSAAKGKRKQTKEASTVPTGGVQTRRTLSKNQNL